MNHLSRLAIYCVAMAVGVLTASCVHEWPEHAQKRTVTLHVSHKLEWTQDQIEITRAGSTVARYHLKVCETGHTDRLVAESEFVRADLTRADFTTAIDLPVGCYDIWVWSDYADGESQKSLFFNSEDFSSVWYPDPYNGNNELRDAFRGASTVKVDDRLESDYEEHAELPLERPLARYEFISIDLAEFLENEISRGERLAAEQGRSAPSRVEDIPLDQYRVKMIYTGYMPSEFNVFTNKPVNSKLGMSYNASVTKLNDDEARLGFDHVMVNGHESSIPVAMEVYDPDGLLIGRTNAIEVPTKRSQVTVVRGRFLTSKASGGVGINPDFNGEYNIEIK
ncbi:MAG: hypothetical protein NC127_00020 [Muribaculum sp.]|nr:hypothetical protein [Muribaculum sp.]